MTNTGPLDPYKYIDRLHAVVGGGCIGFGLNSWANGNVASALAVIPLGVTFLLLVPIRRKGGNMSSHWIWLATGVVIVALLWAYRNWWTT